MKTFNIAGRQFRAFYKLDEGYVETMNKRTREWMPLGLFSISPQKPVLPENFQASERVKAAVIDAAKTAKVQLRIRKDLEGKIPANGLQKLSRELFKALRLGTRRDRIFSSACWRKGKMNERTQT